MCRSRQFCLQKSEQPDAVVEYPVRRRRRLVLELRKREYASVLPFSVRIQLGKVVVGHEVGEAARKLRVGVKLAP